MAHLGVVIPSPLPSGMGIPDIARLAREAEAAGLDCIWAEDLLHRGDAAVLDISCVLSACAGATETIGIGSAIFAPSLRNLSWALKQVATVHLLAKGRFILGAALGSGNDEEYRLAGLTRAGQRERTEEFVSVLRAWGRGDLGSKTVPPTARALLIGAASPPPPLWLGGTSAPALRRAARFGDGWLSGLQTPAEFRASVTELRGLAEQEGRPCPQAGIVLSVAVGSASDGLAARSAALMSSLYGTPRERAAELAIGGTPERVADQIAPYLEAGAEEVALVSAVSPWSDSWPMLAQVRRILVGG